MADRSGDEAIHRSARIGYDQQSAAYAQVRPSYHPAVVARIAERFGSGVVVDLGAGTGIFTGQLVAAGLQPIAIEPVEAMRRKIVEDYPDLTVLDATAERTGLSANGVSVVIVAQAFHWFDHPAALREIRRILEPGGHLVCVWNVRDERVPWVRQWTEIVDRHEGETPRYRSMDWRRAIDSDRTFELVDEWSVPNPVPATPAAVVGRVLSTSFIAALAADTQDEVLREVRSLAESVGSEFEVPYRCELQAWQLA